jgi:predicted permease
MRWIAQLKMRIEMLFHRRKAAEHLNDELRYHLERENAAAGMGAEEARRVALRSFGNPALLRDQTRQHWSWSWLERLGRDVRYGLRTLSRSRGFSFIAVAVMALCIGAATSLFTVVRGVLLQPLPFRDPSHLAMLYEHFRAGSVAGNESRYNVVSPGDYYDWRAQTHGFEDMAAWRQWRFNLSGERGELPEVVDAIAGSWNFFPVVGVQPALGRSFTEAEDHPGASPVVMLTWSLFQRRFAGDASILGRQIHLDGKPYTVVGVLPAAFAYPEARMQLWVPYASVATAEELAHHDFHQSHVVARMKPGVSLANAVGQVAALQYRLHLQYLNAPVAEDAVSRSIVDDMARDVKKPLIILMCAVGCMLLIGCLNVANLLVARGAARQKEVAIRGALGAGRLTLIREQLTESLLICFAGGAIGVLLSLAGTQWMTSAWKDLPRTEGIRMDAAVLAFSCGLIGVAALLAGLLPALSSTGKSVFATLQASSRAGGNLSRTAMRKTLLTVEIAVTVVLLIAAGLLLKSFERMRTTAIGSATDNLLTMTYSLPARKYDTPEKMNAFNERLLERLRAMPGVRGAALGSALPGAGYDGDDVFSIPEHPPLKPGQELPDALYRWADPGYFSALEIPLVNGRFFTGQDRLEKANKVIVSRQLVQLYFPNTDPIGKHLHVPAKKQPDYEIVGVVGDTLWKPGETSRPTMYFPILTGEADIGFALAVRTVSDPLAYSIPVQKAIAEIDPELPVTDVLTMPQVIGEFTGNASFSATLVLAFAVLSLVLASVGLYGVLSYLVTQRLTEIGIRIALGARREQVLRLMLLDGLRPAVIGLAIGLVAGAGATQLIRSVLYGTRPLDPMVFAAVSATLLAVSGLACIVPAWRASRLDPMQALRTE